VITDGAALTARELGFVLRGADKSVYYAGDTREPALAEIRVRLYRALRFS
jgi:hypothetical protein